MDGGEDVVSSGRLPTASEPLQSLRGGSVIAMKVSTRRLRSTFSRLRCEVSCRSSGSFELEECVSLQPRDDALPLSKVKTDAAEVVLCL